MTSGGSTSAGEGCVEPLLPTEGMIFVGLGNEPGADCVTALAPNDAAIEDAAIVGFFGFPVKLVSGLKEIDAAGNDTLA